jgi:anaerobic selenocysteine-containing dehydrogenase
MRIELSDGLPIKVQGDPDDVLSKGYTCPKGMALIDLQNDPDRLKGPVRRGEDGIFRPISWEEAFKVVGEQLNRIRKQHSADSLASYMGTIVVHKHEAMMARAGLMKALGSRNTSSAGSQDTSPRFAVSYFLYGSIMSLPIPDVDRTDYLLCVGANPIVSNGSLLTAPNMRARLKAIRDRGGKIVVVDPRRTETAELADEHVSIKPGGDAAFLLAMCHVLLESGRIDQQALARDAVGWPDIAELLLGFTPEKVAGHAGVAAATIRRLALAFQDARSSVAYARLGVCNSPNSTLASYAIDLLNVLAGRLGKPGGAMFSSPAIDLSLAARLTGVNGFGRWLSRVRGLPETGSDVPSTTLAEEIETTGPGQVRALVTYGGNPVSSVPNGRRLARALASLDFMVAVDMYINETTRFANIILPPSGPLSDEHVDLFFGNVAARNVIRWTTPAIPPRPDQRSDWDILTELSYRLGGGPTGVGVVDALCRLAWRLGKPLSSSLATDLLLRTGPYGDWFLPLPGRLNGKKVRGAAHGIDLGALKPGFKHRVYHRSKRIQLAAAPIVEAMRALADVVQRPPVADELLMIGRRDLRSNNSWMHNMPKLVAGRHARCMLFVHSQDAQRLGIQDGDNAVLESRVHRGDVAVRVTDEMRPGVVSLPHGWGHSELSPWQKVAAAQPGVSANDWTDDHLVESVVGQSIVNGVPVRLYRHPQ